MPGRDEDDGDGEDEVDSDGSSDSFESADEDDDDDDDVDEDDFEEEEEDIGADPARRVAEAADGWTRPVSPMQSPRRSLRTACKPLYKIASPFKLERRTKRNMLEMQ